MKFFLPSILGCLLMLQASGQQATWKYRSHTYGGIVLQGDILGDNVTAPFLQTVQGVYNKRWAIGIGGGIDWYTFRSIPVFFSATRDLAKKSNGLFVTLNAGTNFPAVKKTIDNSDNAFFPGLYWSPSIGLKFRTNKKNNQAVVLSLGYSSKILREQRRSFQFCPGGCANNTEPIEKITYTLRRYDFKLGWQF
jgi:hypothetical protein